MAKGNIKKNYIYNLSYQIVLLIAPLITIPYVSKVLGADGIGTVSYVESVASYFVLFATFGIPTYGQRETSYAQDSKERRSIVFWNAKALSVLFSIAALIIYVMFALTRENRYIYVIYALNIIAALTDITWFFQGMEEFGKIVFRNIIFKIISIIYIFIFIRNKSDIAAYAFGLTFFTFLGNASLWFYLPKYVKLIKKAQLHPFREFKVVLSLFIPTIAMQIYTVIDKTMIGNITKNAFENGYYEQALKISRILLTVVTALGTVMTPHVGYYFEQKNTEEVKRLMYKEYRFVWFIGTPLCLGLIMVSSNFVPWFFGKGYDKVAILLKILAFLILAIGINNVTGIQYLIPTKRQNTFTFTVMVGACANFFMNMILIRYFQSAGAAIASVAAETLIAVTQLIIVRKELSLWKIVTEGIHYYAAGSIMSVGLYFIGRVLPPSVFSTFIIVACGAGMYFTALLVMKDEFLLSNMRAVFSRLKGGR